MELIHQLKENKDSLIRLSKASISVLDGCIQLIRGSLMQKYTFKHGKKQEKEFSITSDLQFFQWKPINSSRNLRKIPISDIIEISSGNSEFHSRNHQEIKQDSESLCFTVHLKERPVNIVAGSAKVQEIWVNSLRALIKHENLNNLEEISNIEAVCDEIYPKLMQELQASDRDVLKSTESLVIEDQTTKLKKKLKEVERSNAKLQKELLDVNFRANKEGVAENELKKEIKSKDKNEKKLHSQLEILNLQFENLEKDYTQKILNFEERLSQKDSKLMEVQAEYDEFKKQIKESFNKTLVQKVQQYRESKEVLCSYVNYLKERLETIEKEVALWQAVVHTHVLPIYQSKKIGKVPQFKQVLEFALDTMERKLLTDRSQTQFMTLLTEARKNVKS